MSPAIHSQPRNRREFLSAVGQGVLAASVGATLASDLGIATARAEGPGEPLTFGPLEPLVALMQETPIARFVPTMVEQLSRGVALDKLLAAGALANARTFGGEDYVGYHTLMALAPAYHMSRELPDDRRPLPVLKVLYRNTNRIHEHGGKSSEVLHACSPAAAGPGENLRDTMTGAIRAADIERADRAFAAIAQKPPKEAFDELLYAVQDDVQVHRTVLPYRAWDLLGLIGYEHAYTLLRQSVHFCVKEQPRTDASKTLVKVLDQHKLAGRTPGDRAADDSWVESMSNTIFSSTPEQACDATAAALAEGFSPAVVGEAISLAANQLVLRDIGRTATQEWPGKPIGSVHGDSVGVHACDSANAWRNMASVGSARNVFACLILNAWQVARDRSAQGDFLHWEPLPIERNYNKVTISDPAELLRELEVAIRGNLQARACLVTKRYNGLGHDARPLFNVLLGYAISEDGALHAEKYYRTVSEEYAATRPAFRGRQLIALARVTASEYGRPAAGCNEAKELLKLA